jgi:hypothetical protein
MFFPKMLFDKGDPREAYAIAEDADQDTALRARGFLPLDESGLHPDQFKDAKAPELPAAQAMTDAEFVATLPKRGPGRPRKD